mmetsp:Transcript_130394/g.194065  ORF Transcript_130394/g.194065 Transcript_130394/m.194065 type:complete len:220 (-) Transcript_130394:600-1259(-)
MLLQCGRRLEEVLLVNRSLGISVAIHVSLVKGFLNGPVGGKGLVEQDIPYFLRYVSRIFVKQHSGKIVADIQQFLVWLDCHNFAKGGGRRFVQKSIRGKQMRRVRWVSIGNSQRRTCRYVSGGVNVAISLFVKIHIHLRLGSVVKHIRNRDDSLIAIRSHTSRLNDVEGPFGDARIIFDLITETVHFFQGVAVIVVSNLFFPSQGKHQWRQTFVAKVSH